MFMPSDFASECPPPRPIGTETEYYDQVELSQKKINDRMARLGYSSVGQFYSNGAKIHPIVGVEYATGEGRGPREAADADFAGIPIIREVTRPPEVTTATANGSKPFPVLRLAGSYSLEHNTTLPRAEAPMRISLPHTRKIARNEPA